MTEPEKGQGADDSELLEDGWGGDDAGFASEHTTVDPNLLSRLAALDAKGKSDSSAKSKKGGNKMPREKTITLDISDLMVDDDDEAETGDEDVHEPVKTEAIDFSTIAAALQDKTEALDADQVLAGAPKAPAPKSGGPIMGGAAVLGGQVEKNSAPIGTPLSGSSKSEHAAPASAPAPAPAPPAPAAPAAPAAEVDPAFANEKTQIFVSAMDDEPTRAKLNIVQGGGQQKEYLLARDRITIGRGTNNDILVPDIAISRQHCEITRQPDGSFRMRDMSSGNGTKLNGARVMDSDLFGGDRIEIGSTVLEFVITGPGASRSPGERKITYHPSEAPSRASQQVAMPPPATQAVPSYGSGGSNATQTHFTMAQQPAPPARSTNILFSLVIAAVALVFLALAVVVGAKIYLDSQKGQTAVAAKSAQEYYFEGISHTKNKEWEKAEEKFTFAMEIAKEERTFQVRKDAELKLDWVRAEKKNAKAIERGQALLKSGDYLEAITKLETVNSGSPYYEEARQTIPEAKGKYAGQLVDKAQKDFETKSYDEADRKITLALTTKPGYQPALDLRKRIDELPKETYKRPPAAVARADRPARPRNDDAAEKPERPKADKTPAVVAAVEPDDDDEPEPKEAPKGKEDKTPAKTSSVVADFTPGLTLYRNKRYAEAVTYFNGIAANSEGYNAKKAKSLAGKIKQFEKLYQAGSSAYASGQHESSQKSLTNALSLDKSVSGGYYRGDITAKLAESHYQLARASFNGSNFPRAGFHCKRVLRYKPNHAGNRQLLGQLETKARALYVDAVNAKKSAPVKAKRICDGIVGMLPESSDVHKKAKKLSKEL